VKNSIKRNKSRLPGELSVYFRRGYDNKGQFSSYWHQINEVFSRNPKSVLEIGVGSGFVSTYLRRYCVRIMTLDIDKGLDPEVVGSVSELPFKDAAFEVIACCEVLEHLPYEKFDRALHELLRVCESHVILSLPQSIGRTYRVLIDIPRFGGIKKIFSLAKSRKPVSPHDGGHHWEVGIVGYPLRRITDDIARAGFVIENTYRVFEKLYHRFFVLRKKSAHQ